MSRIRERALAAAAAASAAAAPQPMEIEGDDDVNASPAMRTVAASSEANAAQASRARRGVGSTPEQIQAHIDYDLKNLILELEKAARDHIKMAPLEQFGSKGRLRLEKHWRANFTRLNLVDTELSGLSWSDLGFRAICASRAAENPHITIASGARVRDTISLDAIMHSFLFVSVYSSQHTPEAKQSWPTPAAYKDFCDMLSHTVFQFFRCVPSDLRRLVRRLDAPTFEWHGLSVHHSEAFNRLRTPPLLQAELDKRHAKADEQKAAGEDVTEQIEVAEESKGHLWRQAADSLVLHFVEKAARFCWVVDSHNALLAEFPRDPNARWPFPPMLKEHLQQWLRRKLRIEQTEAMTGQFRETFLRLALPLGAETRRLRSVQTRKFVATALQMVQAELGDDLSGAMQTHMVNTKMHQLAADPDGEHWEAAFMAVLHYHIMQSIPKTVKGVNNTPEPFDWTKTYVILNPEEPDALARMRDRRFVMSFRKAPVIVRIAKQWWLLYRAEGTAPDATNYKQCLRECDSFAHAWMWWLHLVQRDRQSLRGGGGAQVEHRLENGEHFTHLIHEFLPTEQELAEQRRFEAMVF